MMQVLEYKPRSHCPSCQQCTAQMASLGNQDHMWPCMSCQTMSVNCRKSAHWEGWQDRHCILQEGRRTGKTHVKLE